jgi:hypothetical protein
MKQEVEEIKIQESKLVRTTFVPRTQESLSRARNEEAGASTVLCKDCQYASPVESFIIVDALHVQCPSCLYVFFLDEAQRKALSGAGLNPLGAAASGARR